MSDELGTCLYDATPHQRITLKMAVVSKLPLDHCCGVWWQPLPHNPNPERRQLMTDLDNAREEWHFEREHWNGHGPSIRYDKVTLALINALEARLARAEGVIAKVKAYVDGPDPARSVVRFILSEANKEAS